MDTMTNNILISHVCDKVITQVLASRKSDKRPSLKITQTRKMCSHLNLQTHIGSAIDNPMTLTCWTQGQHTLSACHALCIPTLAMRDFSFKVWTHMNRHTHRQIHKTHRKHCSCNWSYHDTSAESFDSSSTITSSSAVMNTQHTWPAEYSCHWKVSQRDGISYSLVRRRQRSR